MQTITTVDTLDVTILEPRQKHPAFFFNDFFKPFFARQAGKAGIHFCIFVSFAGNCGFQIGQCVTKRLFSNRIAHFLQKIQMAICVSGFTFGSVDLMSGISMIPTMIGAFALSELLRSAGTPGATGALVQEKVGALLATVRVNKIDLATGLAVGGGLRNADNLAIDANGNMYIIEDRDGAVDDDIWFAKDINKDGDLLDAGEGIARWASNGTPGSEFTGLYFDKFNPNVAYVHIQHPGDGVDRTIQITAVPEPESYAMFLAGLGMLGLMARRRIG